MRFAPTDDQVLFQGTVRDLLAKECSPEVVRAAWEGDARPRELWSHLAEMGVLGVLAPESDGGLGLDEVDLVLILEETGRAAAPGPILEHAMVAVPALVEAGLDDTAAQAASGGVTVTVGFGGTAGWVEESDLVVVDRDGELQLVEAAQVEACPRPTVDRSRRSSTITVPGKTTPLDGADPLLAFDRAALGAAAQLVGLASTMIDMAVGYAKERKQFGVPIGSFQAVKHHLADALLAVEYARPAVLRAAWSVAHRLPDRSRDVSMAKALAGRAADVAGRQALQCHGAIGYSYEYDLHLWMKRGWALRAAWGDDAFHRDRVARLVVDA